MTGGGLAAGDLDDRLGEVCELLGELWGIDRALRAGAAALGSGDIDAATAELRHRFPVRLGARHPFTATVFCTDAAPLVGGPQAQAWVDGLRARGVATARAELLPWRTRLADLVEARESQLTSGAEGLHREVTLPLGLAVVDDFAELSHSLGDWQGAAADQFATYFHDRLQAASQTQRVAADGVCAVLAAGGTVVARAQRGLSRALEATAQVLDDQLRQRQRSHAPESASSAGWVLAAATVLAVVAALPTAGASLGLTEVETMLAGAGGVLVSGAPSDTEEEGGDRRRITATHAGEALTGLTRAFTEILERWQANWDDLEERLSGPLRRWVREAVDDGYLWPARPDLIGGVTPAEFHHQSVHY